MAVQIAFNNGAALYLELPVSVELLVASTPARVLLTDDDDAAPALPAPALPPKNSSSAGLRYASTCCGFGVHGSDARHASRSSAARSVGSDATAEESRDNSENVAGSNAGVGAVSVAIALTLSDRVEPELATQFVQFRPLRREPVVQFLQLPLAHPVLVLESLPLDLHRLDCPPCRRRIGMNSRRGRTNCGASLSSRVRSSSDSLCTRAINSLVSLRPGTTTATEPPLRIIAPASNLRLASCLIAP